MRLSFLAVLAAFAALSIAIPVAAQDKRVALVIGNGKYAHAPALPNPANDARDVSAALKRLGFAVTEGYDLDRSGMERRIREFSRDVDGSSIALTFYAGHAIQVGGRNYLLPTDARLQSERDLSYETVPTDLILAEMENAKRVKIAILDACRDNPFEGRLKTAMGPSRSASLGRGLAIMPNTSLDMLTAFAAKDGQVAEDGKGRNSPYTSALLRHMEQPGVDLQRLFGLVRDTVIVSTAGRQQPYVYGSLGGDPIYLRAPSASAVAPSQSSPDRETIYWQSVNDSTDAKDFDAYLKLYPNGHFVDIARNRLAALRPRPESAPRPVQPTVGRYDTQLGEVLRDCSGCPEMVVIPAGSFVMGSPQYESGRSDDELPQRRVTIRSFALGRTEVTFAQYDECANENACPRASDNGWGREDRPVINVSWNDAKAFTNWLSRKSGKTYRLPSEAEWEYAARGGTTSRFYCGDNYVCTYPVAWTTANSGARTQPVGSKPPNAFGLHDLYGNAWEWTEDCYNSNYLGAPTDGSAWLSGKCEYRVIRGGSWGHYPGFNRSAIRFWGNPEILRDSKGGFRVARSN